MGRIKNWNHKFLTKADKEILLKSVVQAIPSYAMSVFLIPLRLVKDIEVVMNSFWWGNEGGGTKGIKWKLWHNLCVPK